MRGDRANATAGDGRVTRRADPEPPARTHVPRKATHSSSAHHSRWTTQCGSPSALPERRRTGPSGTGSRTPGSAPGRARPRVPQVSARARNGPGSTARSSLVSATIRPGDCGSASPRNPRQTASRRTRSTRAQDYPGAPGGQSPADATGHRTCPAGLPVIVAVMRAGACSGRQAVGTATRVSPSSACRADVSRLRTGPDEHADGEQRRARARARPHGTRVSISRIWPRVASARAMLSRRDLLARAESAREEGRAGLPVCAPENGLRALLVEDDEAAGRLDEDGPAVAVARRPRVRTPRSTRPGRPARRSSGPPSRARPARTGRPRARGTSPHRRTARGRRPGRCSCHRS